MPRKFTDYFIDTREYLSYVGFEMLPMGTLFDYIGDGILNALINHTKILKAYVLGQGEPWDQLLEEPVKVSVQIPPGSLKWYSKYCQTRNDLYSTLTEEDAVYHVHLATAFNADVMILAEAEGRKEGEKCYLFFLFSLSNKGNAIGRFITNDPKEDVITSFSGHLEVLGSNEYDPYGAREIPLHYFKGWIQN